MTKALVLIDVQNDYFSNGKFPLWNTEQTLENIVKAIKKAQKNKMLVLHIQHIADPAMGLSPFFNEGTEGAEIHPKVLELTPEAPRVIKAYADGFEKTNLENILLRHGIEELFIGGMMTQNCVTHTAISKTAEKYRVNLLVDCCTTTNEIIHQIALHAISTRVPLLTTEML